MRIDINAHIQPAAILQSRGLGDSTAACRFLANDIARLCDPYVPMQQGTLKNSKQIESDGSSIQYNTPYAHYQYYGEVMAGRAPKHYTGKPIDYHGGPMRGPRWNQRMMADRGNEVIDNLAKFLGGKRK